LFDGNKKKNERKQNVYNMCGMKKKREKKGLVGFAYLNIREQSTNDVHVRRKIQAEQTKRTFEEKNEP
jgi:hypothetical protein